MKAAGKQDLGAPTAPISAGCDLLPFVGKSKKVDTVSHPGVVLDFEAHLIARQPDSAQPRPTLNRETARKDALLVCTPFVFRLAGGGGATSVRRSELPDLASPLPAF